MCTECQGPGDRGKSCDGRKVTPAKIPEVHIDKNVKDDQEIRFHGEPTRSGKTDGMGPVELVDLGRKQEQQHTLWQVPCC
jgi:DnaJ-class molecular chaperone